MGMLIDKNDNTDREQYNYSIVVPCYNCEATIDKTVSSLLNQKCEDGISYQIILVDDGSKDQTPDKCDAYAANYEIVSSIHQSNGGLVDAWKRGVKESWAEYIAFCDSDDFISEDFLSRIDVARCTYDADIITFGMRFEYKNGKAIMRESMLPEGFYTRPKIVGELFPILLSNGKMQSNLVMPSRCCKVFKRKLLLSIIDDIPEYISNGEDRLTTFSAIMNCSSVYSMRGYYPYHYCRNSESMIGAYDEFAFSKIERTYFEMEKLADKYGYANKEQIVDDQFSTVLLYMKKELGKNPNGYKASKNKLIDMWDSAMFQRGMAKRSDKSYDGMSRLFALLMIKKLFGIAYILVKMTDSIRKMDV